MVREMRDKRSVERKFGRKKAESYALLFLLTLMLAFLPACGSSEGASDASADAGQTAAEEQSAEESGLNLKNAAAGVGLSTGSVNAESKQTDSGSDGSISLEEIPAYSGSPYVEINDNNPFFTDADLTEEAFESYSDLDSLGRCGQAYANVGKELMPTEERGEIGSIKPSGWHTVKYDCVSGKYLYNRCHLIGYQLTAENANEKNLITGTRYLNVEGMLPFENMVADYVEETNNHVLYRVTPYYEGDNLLASGVLIEAKSVEDEGDGILFNVYCYNVQPGISINYANGDSAEDGSSGSETKSSASAGTAGSAQTGKSAAAAAGAVSNSNQTAAEQSSAGSAQESVSSSTSAEDSSDSDKGETIVHITDTGSKYHNAGCRTLKSDHEVTLEKAKSMGLEPCKVCNPPK